MRTGLFFGFVAATSVSLYAVLKMSQKPGLISPITDTDSPSVNEVDYATENDLYEITDAQILEFTEQFVKDAQKRHKLPQTKEYLENFKKNQAKLRWFTTAVEEQENDKICERLISTNLYFILSPALQAEAVKIFAACVRADEKRYSLKNSTVYNLVGYMIERMMGDDEMFWEKSEMAKALTFLQAKLDEVSLQAMESTEKNNGNKNKTALRHNHI